MSSVSKANILPFLFFIILFIMASTCGENLLSRLLLHKLEKRQAAATGPDFPTNRWDSDKPIPYFFDDQIPVQMREIVRQAIASWENASCLRFQENGDGGEQPRVRFQRGTVCASHLGRDVDRKSEQQNVTIADSCSNYARIAHEIGHVLGLIHTQVRSDRDQFITVLDQNLPKEMASSFEKFTEAESSTLGVDYDYGSLMHWSAFNLDGKPIMQANKAKYQHTMGNSYGPVFSDLLAINRFYGCGRICLNVQSPECKNGGIPNPKRCSKCICPGGFGGEDCAGRAQGEGRAPAVDCGETVRAESQWTELKGSVEADPGGQLRQEGCHFHILASQGKRVELRVESLSGKCSAECLLGALEIKFERRMTAVGARLCCRAHIGDVGLIRSQGPLAVVSIFSQQGKRSFRLLHREIDFKSEQLLPVTAASVPNENERWREFFMADMRSFECQDESPNCVANRDACSLDQHKDNMAKLCRMTCGLCSTTINPSTFLPTFSSVSPSLSFSPIDEEFKTTAEINNTNKPQVEQCRDLASGCEKISYLCSSGSRIVPMFKLCACTCSIRIHKLSFPSTVIRSR